MSTVLVDRDREVLVVTINRPEVRNAVDMPTAEALLRAFQEYDRDDATSVAVLTGAGGTFCAGADLKAIAAGERRALTEDAPAPLGPTRLLLSKPVLAAVEGHAVAGVALQHRVVGAELLDKPPVARAARVGDHNRVKRPLLGAAAGKPDFQRHRLPLT